MSLVRFERVAFGAPKISTSDWIPAVDVFEKTDRFVVRADIPGVNPADIDVNMEAGILTVSCDRHTEDRSDVDGVSRFERATGRFSRSFTLPESADADGIKAQSLNGILEISIPKQPKVQARRITVEAA